MEADHQLMLPIKLLHDRVLVSVEADSERHSSGGILIPVTASVGKRLAWASVVATGPNVRHMTPGDRVLFEPEDRAVVELQGASYVLLRERDVHAVAAEHVDTEETGLYL